MLRIRKGIATACGLGLLLVAGIGFAAPAQASNPPCYANSDGSMICGNPSPIPVGKEAKMATYGVDYLRSNPSWFKCYVRSVQHTGGNNVWYYTYGDDYGKWGYIPASHVYTPTDPLPGVRQC